MEALQNRIDSFAKTKTKRVKTGQKSRTVTLKWPHPPAFLANPAALAEAGFYYSPSLEDQDNVICFECGKQLSEWEEQDDPFDVHWSKCADKCSWAAVRCGLRADLDRHKRFTFPDKSRLPGTKKMEEARLGTFTTGDGWVHDQAKNHGASSLKMAQAGFVWAPQHPGDDLGTCFYCNIALSGWEKDDDPMEEHRKRGKPGETCPFLSYTGNAKVSTITTTAEPEHAPKRTRSTSIKPSSRSQSKTVVAPSQSRASKPTRARAMSSRRTKGATENDDDEDLQLPSAASEGEEDTPPAPSQLTRSTSVKPLSRSQSKTAAPRSKSRASKISKSRVAPSRGKKDDVVADVAASGATRRKTRKVVDEEPMDIVDDDEDEQPPSQPASEEEDELDPRAQLTRSTSIKPASKSLLRTEAPSKSPRASRTTKKRVAATSTRRKTRKVVDEDVTDIADNEDVQPPSQLASEEEDELDPRAQFTRSTLIKPASKSLSRTEAPSKSPRASRTTKKGVAATGTRRKTRKVVDEEFTDIVDNEDVQPPSQLASEEEDELDPQPRSTSTNPPSRSHSKAGAARSQSRTSRAQERETATGRRNVADDDVVDDEDTLPPTQPALEEDVHLLRRRALEQENITQPAPDQLTQLVSAKQPLSARSKIEATPLQPQASETPKTEALSAPGTSQSKTRDGPLDDIHMGQVPTEEKKTSILQKTPPPVELFSLNFASTPKQDLPMPVAAPQSTLPNSDAFLIPSTKGETVSKPKTPEFQCLPPTVSDEVAPKLKTPEPQILPPLSRIPFMPLQTLTDAELHMTVEEWIRYQMEVEFDKLKRDGEKEMARFKARAEEVRKMIESL